MRPITVGHVATISSLMRLRRYRSWLVASLQPATLICLLMIIVLWAVLSYVLLVERQRTLQAAISQSGNLVRLFEESTASMVHGVDRTLLLLSHEYDDDPARFNLSHRAKWSSLP